MIVADSSYFVALADSKDRWHGDALRVKASIPQDFLLTVLIVAEAVTIVGARRGGRPAQVLYQYFVDECEIEFADAALLRDAMVHHLFYDGVLSVADCVTVAIMSERGIRKIVSFDGDFDRVRGLERVH